MPSPSPNRFFSPWRILALLVLAGVWLRLKVALGAPWYWDEGYMAELAWALGQGGRPQVGALWHDGFFPLSTSWLAPWSAAPLAHAPFFNAMTGVRLWAVGWEALAMGLLALLGRRLGSWRVGLVAAGAYALLPFAVQYGGRAFYHHFAAAFMLAAVLAGWKAVESGERRATVTAALATGLAVATCYWLWWLPLTWTAWMAWKRPQRLVLALACQAGLVLPVLALGVVPDPAGAGWSVGNLLATTSVGGPRGVGAFAWALGQNLREHAFLAAGLAGAVLAAWRAPKRWAWPCLLLALAVAEPVRQRGNITAMPYPFILAAPLAALGLAGAVDWAWRPGAFARWALGALLAAGFARPLDTGWIELWSSEPAKVAQLKGFLTERGPGLVCGLPGFNWFLRPGLEVCEPFELGAAENRPSGFYGPGAPASRFARPSRVEDVRYVVLSRIHFLGVLRFDGVALSLFEMERQGWPLVFDNRAFKVYENPAFGASPDPGARLLLTAENYQRAAGQAARAGRQATERAALARSREAAP